MESFDILKFNNDYKELIKTHRPCSICNNFKLFEKYDCADNKKQRLRADCKDCRKLRNSKYYREKVKTKKDLNTSQ